MSPVGEFRRESLPPARTFYQREFGSALHKERGGWATTACCFHQPDRHPSLRLRFEGGGAFRCFSCGAHGGDIVAFLMLRDHLSFPDAARELGAWEDAGLSAEQQSRSRQERRRREEARKQLEAQRQAKHRERIAVRDWLHLLERVYKQTTNRLTQLRKGDAERYTGEEETLWGILSDCLPQIRTAAAQYSELAGVTYVE